MNRLERQRDIVIVGSLSAVVVLVLAIIIASLGHLSTSRVWDVAIIGIGLVSSSLLVVLITILWGERSVGVKSVSVVEDFDDVGYDVRSCDDAVTANRRIEEMRAALRYTALSRDYLNNILSSMNDALIVTDRYGTIELVNEALCTLLGYERRELIDQPLQTLMIVPTVEFYPLLSALFEPRALSGVDAELKAHDGRTIPVALSGAALRGPRGEHHGIVFVAQDMSERQRVQRQLETAKLSAEAASRAKSEFLATMSHEVRTPLNGVLGITDVLLGSDLDETQRDLIDTLRGSADALLTIINDILDFSKAEAGKLELESLSFDLREILDEVLGLVATTAHRKGLTVGALVDNSVPVRVIGDPNRVRQVLFNLIGNSIKFTDQGHVLVRVDVLSIVDQHVQLRLCVDDTGIGIASDQLASIFREFSQGDRSTTRRYGGSGLGLTIVERLVELMRGSVGVESTLGVGSRFCFSIPLMIDTQLSERHHYEVSLLGGRRILVIAAERLSRKLVCSALSHWPLSIDCVDGFAAARQRWVDALDGRIEPYELVILDWPLSTDDRGHLATEIESFDQLTDLPVLVVRSPILPGSDGDIPLPTQWQILRKPIRMHSLIDAIVTRLESTESPPSASPPGEKRAKSAIDAAEFEWRALRFCARVLVAEDNPTNQKVAVPMLEQMGCQVDIAANGLEAIERVATTEYDLLFMDCQMPALDGYRATERIRAAEHEEQRKRLPIVALTANALPDGRDACLRAGMDDYLSKPLLGEDLAKALLTWIPDRQTSNADVDVLLPECEPREAIFDETALARLSALDASGGNDLLQEVLSTFLAHSPILLARIETGWEAEDYTAICEAAHSLKSSSAQVGARRVASLAGTIESLARQGPSARYAANLSALNAAFEQATEWLNAALDSPIAEVEDTELARLPDDEQARVLIVDDDPMLCHLTREVLLSAGFDVVDVTRGVEAFDEFSRYRPDIVLLDVNMPELDGFAVCQQIRACPEGLYTPILMLTGRTDVESVNRAYAAGATDFITKPVHYPLLTHRLRYALRGVRTAEALRASEFEVRRLAYCDVVTGLPNRACLRERLDAALEHARAKQRALAVLFLDLDQFKLINDTMGHSVGDQLLRQTAARLKDCLRIDDDFGRLIAEDSDNGSGSTVARLGGDEFVIIANDIADAQAAVRFAARIIAVLETPFVLDNREVYIRTSIGISLFPDHALDADDLLKHADTAMYEVKREGRNNYRFFSEAMRSGAEHRLDMITELSLALDDDQLVLHYQPKLDTQSGESRGAEALLRWNHPRRGLVPPDEFIPLAEECGMIVPIGEWVLREACRQARRWQLQGFADLRIAVNLSATQLRQPDLAERLAAILDETGLAASSLEVELTESVIMKDADGSIAILAKLKEIGVAIAVDDFGTGYSSLAYLKRLPLDALKVDRSFIQDIGVGLDGDAIISMTIALAQQLNLRVTAEGVEHPEQWEFLRALGCDEVQGYLFGVPMCTEQFEHDYLARRVVSPTVEC